MDMLFESGTADAPTIASMYGGLVAGTLAWVMGQGELTEEHQVFPVPSACTLLLLRPPPPPRVPSSCFLLFLSPLSRNPESKRQQQCVLLYPEPPSQARSPALSEIDGLQRPRTRAPFLDD